MIDWTRIDELRSEIGEDGFDEVVEIFLDEVAETLAELDDLPKGAERAARLHFLKGSALNLGFTRVADLCKAAELDQEATSASEIADAFSGARHALVARLLSGELPAA